jgi:HlyD family secretion protein
LRVAEAQAQQAVAGLAQAQTNLNYTQIVAPIDGVVITRSIDPGQTVAASFQAPTLFIIANDLTHMRVLADVDEADIGRLHEGMPADVRVDAFPGETFHGLLRELRFAPTTTQGVVTYPAVIEVNNPDGKLRPGMTATITVITAQRTGVLRVPNAALRYHPSTHGEEGHGPRGGRGGRAGAGGGDTKAGGAPGEVHGPRERDGQGGAESRHVGRVFVLRNGEAARVTVRTGASDGVYTEVEAPELHPGVRVITDETDGPEGSNASGPSGPAGGGGGGRAGRMRVF